MPVIDLIIAMIIVLLAWRTFAARQVFAAVVLFIVYGLVLSMAWVRLRAPDVAIAEAAIGAGVTGALLLEAVGFMERRDLLNRHSGAAAMWKRQARRSASAGRPRPLRIMTGGFAVLLAIGLGFIVVDLAGRPVKGVLGGRGAGPGAEGLAEIAMERLPESGVTNPVTAVLLNFRSIDTWLELGVLILAAMGVFALQRTPSLAHLPRVRRAGYVLMRMTGLFVPLMILGAGYLLWQGTHGSGGAFQAGALLAAAGIMLRLRGSGALRLIPDWCIRGLIVLSFVFFALAGLAFMAAGRAFLEYPPPPPPAAGLWIFLIELVAAISIGVGLVALFLGAHPAPWRGGRRPPKDH